MQRAFGSLMLDGVRNRHALSPALNRKKDQHGAEDRNVTPESHC